MTCAQGLLRLLWGGPEVGVLRDWLGRCQIHSSFLYLQDCNTFSYYASYTIKTFVSALKGVMLSKEHRKQKK